MSSSSAGGGADNQMEALTNKLSQFSLRKRKKRRRKRKAAVVPTKKPEPKQQLVRSLRLWDDQGPSLTRWDASTRTLLNITLTFLRHAPEVELRFTANFFSIVPDFGIFSAGRQPPQKSWHCFKAVRSDVSGGRGLVPISYRDMVELTGDAFALPEPDPTRRKWADSS